MHICVGCTDPNAMNFDPAAVVDDGTCNYIAESSEETGLTEDLKSYVTNTVSRVWNNNFKGDTTEPADYKSTGYSYSGRVSQRDITRLVSHTPFVKTFSFLSLSPFNHNCVSCFGVNLSQSVLETSDLMAKEDT